MATTAGATGGRVRRRRLLLAACLGLALLGAGLGVARAVRQRERPPAPPEVEPAGADPAGAAAVEQARARVLDAPDSGDAWGRLGQVLLANGLPEEACACFAEAERLDPREPRWPYLRGMARTLMGEAEDAVSDLRRAVELCDPADAAPRLRLAEALLGQGRAGDAGGLFRALLEQDPNSPWAHLGLGRVCCRRGDFERGLAHLRRAAASPLTEKAARTALAETYHRRGDAKAAGRELRRAAELPPARDFPDPYLDEVDRLRAGRYSRTVQANRLIDQGRAGEAVPLLLEVVRDHPDLAEARLSLGLALIRQGDPAGAERALRAAIRLDPKLVRARFYLGLALLRQGNTAGAAELFRQALALKPDHAPSWYHLGLCRKVQGDPAGAAEALRTAVRHKPNFIEARLELAELLLASGGRAEAVGQLKAVVEMNPENARARDLLAKRQR